MPPFFSLGSSYCGLEQLICSLQLMTANYFLILDKTRFRPHHKLVGTNEAWLTVSAQFQLIMIPSPECQCFGKIAETFHQLLHFPWSVLWPCVKPLSRESGLGTIKVGGGGGLGRRRVRALTTEATNHILLNTNHSTGTLNCFGGKGCHSSSDVVTHTPSR